MTTAKIYHLITLTGVNLSQGCIAVTLGCSRKHVNTAVRNFEKLGLVKAYRHPPKGIKKAIVQYYGQLQQFHVIDANCRLSYKAVLAYFAGLNMVRHSCNNLYGAEIHVGGFRLSTALQEHSVEAWNELIDENFLKYIKEDDQLILKNRTGILYNDHDKQILAAALDGDPELMPHPKMDKAPESDQEWLQVWKQQVTGT